MKTPPLAPITPDLAARAHLLCVGTLILLRQMKTEWIKAQERKAS